MPLPAVAEELSPGRGRRRQIVGAMLAIGVLAAAYVCFPRDASMSEADWSHIADRLELAYGLLKKGLTPPVHE
jgi:hypothetical protein